MTASLIETNGLRMLILSLSGQPLRSTQGILELIGDALSQRATVIVAPVERIDLSFFQLASGVAGDIVQKIVNYRLQLAIVGDISAYTAVSTACRDFVREANRGSNIFFLPNRETLLAKLSSGGGS